MWFLAFSCEVAFVLSADPVNIRALSWYLPYSGCVHTLRYVYNYDSTSSFYCLSIQRAIQFQLNFDSTAVDGLSTAYQTSLGSLE